MKTARAGYTLIEMLIVIGVIALLSTIVYVNLTGPAAEGELDATTNLMEAEIRQVTTWSQTGKLEATTGLLPEGYGIVIVPGSDKYLLYAEFGGNQKYNVMTSDVVIDSRSLSDDELVDTINFSSCAPGFPNCDMFVSIYSGELYTNGLQVNDLDFTLEHTVSGGQLQITVDRVSGAVNHN